MAKKPLGTLLSDSWTFFQKHLVTIVAGAVVFGLLNGFLGQSINMQGKKFATNMMEQMGTGDVFTPEKMAKMQELSMKAMQGDTTAEAELELMGKQMEAAAEGMEDKMKDAMNPDTAKMMGNFAGMLGKGILLSMLIGAIAAAYFLSIAVFGIADIGTAVNKTIGNILPVLGLWIWVFIRSFMWIPVIGIVTGIILGPRFIVAPLNLLEGKKGVFDSASMSYKQTSGLWGKIFGNMFVAGLCVWLTIIVVGMVLSMFGAMGGWATAILSQLGSAFLVIFGVQLARTVQAK